MNTGSWRMLGSSSHCSRTQGSSCHLDCQRRLLPSQTRLVSVSTPAILACDCHQNSWWPPGGLVWARDSSRELVTQDNLMSAVSVCCVFPSSREHIPSAEIRSTRAPTSPFPVCDRLKVVIFLRNQQCLIFDI